jgi:hypothetical protein
MHVEEIIIRSTTRHAKLLSERCERTTFSCVFRIINMFFVGEMVAELG